MNCPACGVENREGAHFCRRCGLEMSELAPSSVMEAVGGEPTLLEEEASAAEAPGADTEAEVNAGAEGEGGPEAKQAGGEQEMRPAVGRPPKEPPARATEEVDLEAEVGKAHEGPAGATAEGSVAQVAVPATEEPDLTVAGATDQAPSEADAPPPAEDLPLWEDEDLFDFDDDVLGFWREEAEPVQPVEIGTVLAGRYEIMEALDVQKEGVLYQAHDLGRCWQCGFEGNSQGDAFCGKCGAAQDRRPSVRLLQVRHDDAVLPEGGAVVRQFVHDGQTFLLLTEEGPKPEEEAPSVWGIQLLVGQRSDPGQVRELDEDSLLALTITPNYEARTGPVLGLFSVADGMGGHEGGEIASRMAIQVLAEEAMRHIILPMMAGDLVLDEELTARLRRATIAANDAIYLARQKRGNDMGTTLTTVLVRDERLFVAHVGDSRAYRWNAEGLEQLTNDHSVVASMVAEGRAAPEEIYSHPHRSVIYRCVGDKPTVKVDTDMLPLAPGDRIVLCSDGLWEAIRDEGIKDVMMQEADPQAAADLLVKHANLAGGEDNISVIVCQIETI